MRIYSDLFEAVRETERDLYEMGISVHPPTMQDIHIADNPDYCTKEIRGYAFKLANYTWNAEKVLKYFFKEEYDTILNYINIEFAERTSGVAHNPGKAYKFREHLWKQFLHDDKFAYTYSERISPQLGLILFELRKNPETRQAIMNIHSNICSIPSSNAILAKDVYVSQDLENMGGIGRVPCSMYYQMMVREGKLDLIYTMRSCDFLVHFPIDIILAIMLQNWFAGKLNLERGVFTWFCGSLHAYYKDLKMRGVF